MKLFQAPSFVAIILTLSVEIHAEVTLPPVISAHMVLQRNIAAPIWGTANPGERVSVSIAGQSKTVTAGRDGHWLVKLDPLEVAEGLAMTVKGNNIIEVKDVLVGEVWLGSGQSNMAGAMRTFRGMDEGLQKTLAAAPYPQIRLIEQGGTGWQVATAVNVDGFSANLFAFGSRLHAELDVPVGLMVGAVGGTPSGYWLTEEMYRSDAACQTQVKEFAKTDDFAKAMQGYERYMTAWRAHSRCNPTNCLWIMMASLAKFTSRSSNIQTRPWSPAPISVA
jgi:sialate O-acetylesterase